MYSIRRMVTSQSGPKPRTAGEQQTETDQDKVAKPQEVSPLHPSPSHQTKKSSILTIQEDSSPHQIQELHASAIQEVPLQDQV